jgi:sec-independent protein translocase protein TatA
MFEGLFQPTHLLIILGIALLVLGPRKIPELARGIGEGIRGFKSALKVEDTLPSGDRNASEK